MKYFGDLSHDAKGDEDKDKLSNLEEYNAGTDPTRAIDSEIDNWLRVAKWAENQFPQYFPIQNRQEMTFAPFEVYYYPRSNTYLGYNTNDKQLYVYNPMLWGQNILSVGLLEWFLSLATNSGF
jgi:hypothetical protein